MAKLIEIKPIKLIEIVGLSLWIAFDEDRAVAQRSKTLKNNPSRHRGLGHSKRLGRQAGGPYDSATRARPIPLADSSVSGTKRM